MSRVLIADDDHGFLFSLMIALRRENYEVWAAENSEQALDLLDARRFDFMLVDLRLGLQCGVELAEWARLRYPELPVVFMSAYPYTELSGRIGRISPHPVLEKPFDVSDIGKLLENQPAGEQ